MTPGSLLFRSLELMIPVSINWMMRCSYGMFSPIVSSKVTDLTANSNNDTVLVVSWGHPAHPNGNILSYFVSIINLKDGSTVRNGNVSNSSIEEKDLGEL